MRNALKNVFGKELIISDGSCFLYTIKPYEMVNTLGTIIAVLDEYSFTKKGSTETYKLYKTKEGNWYNIPETNVGAENRILRELKQGFDETSTIA